MAWLAESYGRVTEVFVVEVMVYPVSKRTSHELFHEMPSHLDVVPHAMKAHLPGSPRLEREDVTRMMGEHQAKSLI